MYVVVTQLDEVKTVKIRFMRFMSHWGKTVADTLLRTRSHTHTHVSQTFFKFTPFHFKLPVNYNFFIKLANIVASSFLIYSSSSYAGANPTCQAIFAGQGFDPCDFEFVYGHGLDGQKDGPQMDASTITKLAGVMS